LNIIVVVHSNVTIVVPFVAIVVPFAGSVIHLKGTTVIPFVAIVVPFAGSVVHLNRTTVIPFVAIVVPFVGSVVHLNGTTAFPFVVIVVPFCESYRSFECNNCRSLCHDFLPFFLGNTVHSKRNICCSFLRLFLLLFLSFKITIFHQQHVLLIRLATPLGTNFTN
jgi:hypothetical protein